jgi:hypothetical protein
MAGRKKKLSEKDVLASLEKTHGLISLAALDLGVAYNTLASFIRQSEGARALIESNQVRRVDAAEYKLDAAIERGEPWAVALVLKGSRAGKSRGYWDSVAIGGDPDNPIVIKNEISDEERLERMKELAVKIASEVGKQDPPDLGK